MNEAIAGKALDQPEGRAKALFDAKPLLQALPANALRAQIMHMFADRLHIPFEEVAALSEVDARIAAAPRQAPARSERRRVTDSEKRALRTLVMYPRIATALDDEQLATLRTLPRIGELFAEVAEHARALGDGAEFRLLSDVLRASSNSATYDEIFREILDYDENVRDLLLQNPEDETVFERQREQERIAGEELQAAVLKMRYDACCDRLDRLARQSTFTPEELTELTELNQLRTDMKRRLGL